MGLPGRAKVRWYFSRPDTMDYVTDMQTDRQTDNGRRLVPPQPRLRTTSRGKNSFALCMLLLTRDKNETEI